MWSVTYDIAFKVAGT